MIPDLKSNLLIEVTYIQQVEVENICTEENKTISQYFIELHNSYMQNKLYEVEKESEHEESELKNSEKHNPETKKQQKKKV